MSKVVIKKQSTQTVSMFVPGLIASFAMLAGSMSQASINEDLVRAASVKIPLRGSHAAQLEKSQHLGKMQDDEAVQASFILRRNNAQEFAELVKAIKSNNPLVHTISREELSARYGARPEDVQAVTDFAKAHGLQVLSVDAATRSVKISGAASSIQAALAVEMHKFRAGNQVFHSHVGEVQVPVSLSGVIESVVGLNNRAVLKPHLRQMLNPRVNNATTPLTAPQLATHYNFPTGNGAGQCISILELGGGYNVSDNDIYFKSINLPTPSIASVSVDSATNNPSGDPQSADSEVGLDIQVAGSVAPSAKILVYFAPNTDVGFIDAINAAAKDRTNHCSTMSISWGAPENSWTSASVTAMDQAFQNAVALGITVFVAAGDNGSSDGQDPNSPDVADFPSSDPNVVACGGTQVLSDGSEIVWNNDNLGFGATGGGISSIFKVPAYQNGLKATLTEGGSAALTGRGVPDIAGDASPLSGYSIYIDGSMQNGIGGTSAVAPLFAGLFAVINGNRSSGSVGFANTTMYAHPEALNIINTGNNGTYAATNGWSAASGLGTPNGKVLQSVLNK